MIIDARQGAVPTEIECDLCIVGGGAAGLTVAHELADSRLSICLLEGGGLRIQASTQSLLAGETADSPYAPLHTVVSALGGSKHVWAGWCRPLDRIDFEARAAAPRGCCSMSVLSRASCSVAVPSTSARACATSSAAPTA